MNASSTQNIVAKLSCDLNINKEYVQELISKYGMLGAGRILGNNVLQYDNFLMAGRLAIEDLKQNCPKTILEYTKIMRHRLNDATYNFMVQNHEILQSIINKNEFRDYDHDWFSAITMKEMYSAIPYSDHAPVETPQFTWMRIAVQLFASYEDSLNNVLKAYEEMSAGYYTPASPTLFNAGMKKPQMASCFLLTIGDSLPEILGTGILIGGLISKASGGLGFDISRVRHSEIGDVGKSQGIIPMLQVYNDMVRYANQNGRRKGAATFFLRPHHIDVIDFVMLSGKIGDRYLRAYDINTCLWTSWIFWERIRDDGIWTMFCPNKVSHLNELYGNEFTDAYIKCEQDTSISDKYKKTIKARELHKMIMKVQTESGMPYLMNCDAVNTKSNHKHLGYIKSSNLCLEIVEFTDDESIASCNLHSLSLRTFGKSRLINQDYQSSVDFENLGHIARRVVINLNRVIDENWYPLDDVKTGMMEIKQGVISKTNKKHRPIGMGVSGFAELLHILDLPFEDPRVLNLNKALFACIYWNALAQSVQLAINEGFYESFPGSPTSYGLLQFDLWKEEFKIRGPNPSRKESDDDEMDPSFWGQKEFNLTNNDIILPNWQDLKRCIIKYGLRNSLITALMPTATTAQVRRNCESVEAHQNNLYTRKVLSGNYFVLNRYLVKDLEEINCWNETTIDYLKDRNGSISEFRNFVENNKSTFSNVTNFERLSHIEQKYKTIWEIPQKLFMKLAADRSRYVDQSSSTNIYFKEITEEKLRACQLYANNLGLKTIMYYLRQAGSESVKFATNTEFLKQKNNKKFVCTDDVCVSCT